MRLTAYVMVFLLLAFPVVVEPPSLHVGGIPLTQVDLSQSLSNFANL